MKNSILLLVLSLFTLQISAQESFKLKEVDSKKRLQEFEKSNYQTNIILAYFEDNYKATSGKLDILKDKEMGNVECGFTKKFEHGIVYTYHNCGETAPVKENITLPKTDMAQLKKWIEGIHKANPSEIENVWYKGEKEFGPKDEGVGCYYKIKETKNNSIIDVWCGC